MGSSRDSILAAVRSCSVQPADHPGSFVEGIVYADPVKQFGESLATVGGRLLLAKDPVSAREQLADFPVLMSAAKTCSLFPDIVQPNVNLDVVDDPHTLESVDVAVVRGEFAVAENAAVWFSGETLRHRVLPFITQHLVLVVPAGNVMSNMHQAYERLSFQKPEFGVFISGPSKTADIEQSLVIGAHGPRSLVVVLLG